MAESQRDMFVYNICIDFDGVLHSYTSPWAGADRVLDPPVDGAIEWLRELIAAEKFRPMIYSSRSDQEGGVKAMKLWLMDNGLTLEELEQLEFPTTKPSPFLTIDDRAVCFEGEFPSLQAMSDFKPWNKR